MRKEADHSVQLIAKFLLEKVLPMLLATNSAMYPMVSIALESDHFLGGIFLRRSAIDGGIYGCIVPSEIALTYDDGPWIYTDEMVNVLNSYGAKATFFITGINNGKGAIDTTPAWNAVIKKMYAGGHQLASHTWSHADLSTLTETRRRDEMVRLFCCLSLVFEDSLTVFLPKKTVQTRDGDAQHRRFLPNIHAAAVFLLRPCLHGHNGCFGISCYLFRC